MTDIKDPFCQLELVFRDPRIDTICQQLDFFAASLAVCDDSNRAEETLSKIASELATVLIELVHTHLDEDDADEFLEAMNETPTVEWLNAFLSLYRQKRRGAQNGDAA